MTHSSGSSPPDVWASQVTRWAEADSPGRLTGTSASSCSSWTPWEACGHKDRTQDGVRIWTWWTEDEAESFFPLEWLRVLTALIVTTDRGWSSCWCSEGSDTDPPCPKTADRPQNLLSTFPSSLPPRFLFFRTSLPSFFASSLLFYSSPYFCTSLFTSNLLLSFLFFTASSFPSLSARFLVYLILHFLSSSRPFFLTLTFPSLPPHVLRCFLKSKSTYSSWLLFPESSEQQFTLLSFTTSLSPAFPLPCLPLSLPFVFISSLLPSLLLSFHTSSFPSLSPPPLPLDFLVLLSFLSSSFLLQPSPLFPSLSPSVLPCILLPFITPPFAHILLYSFSYLLLSPLTWCFPSLPPSSLNPSPFLRPLALLLKVVLSFPRVLPHFLHYLLFSLIFFLHFFPFFLLFRCFLLVFHFFLLLRLLPSLTVYLCLFLPYLLRSFLFPGND